MEDSCYDFWEFSISHVSLGLLCFTGMDWWITHLLSFVDSYCYGCRQCWCKDRYILKILSLRDFFFYVWTLISLWQPLLQSSGSVRQWQYQLQSSSGRCRTCLDHKHSEMQMHIKDSHNRISVSGCHLQICKSSTHHIWLIQIVCKLVVIK